MVKPTEYKKARRINEGIRKLSEPISEVRLGHFLAAREVVSGIHEAAEKVRSAKGYPWGVYKIKEFIEDRELPLGVRQNIGKIFWNILNPDHERSVLHEELKAKDLKPAQEQIKRFEEQGLLKRLKIVISYDGN
ncbi:MAG: hypothetical protein J7K68_02655 [Candidatus Diapherotrites archaeon]|nr:hypothetical protein [Candidatus Diapherotrites archaeon]